MNRFKRTIKILNGLLLLVLLTISSASGADSFKPFTADSFEAIKTQYEGKEFLLGLWSVDCPPCLVELAMLGTLLDENPDFPFVLISTDPIEQRESAIEYLEDFNLHARESWMFADSFTERLRYAIDPNWFGELPRSYYFDAGHNRVAHSGILTRERLSQWFNAKLQ